MHALLRGAQSAPRRVVVGADTTAVSAPPKTTQPRRSIRLDHRSRRAALFRTLLVRQGTAARRAAASRRTFRAARSGAERCAHRGALRKLGGRA